MSTSVRNRVKSTKLRQTEDVDEKSDPAPSSKAVARPIKKTLAGDADYYDDQFEDTAPAKVPVKSICVAIILLVLGTIMLTLGSLMLIGVIKQGAGSFRAAPLMVIGSIIFIPGAYNVRTAYCAWKGYHGYHFDDIAGFGENQ